MPPDNRRFRIASAFSTPAAGALTVLFFLPWVRVTCGGSRVAQLQGPGPRPGGPLARLVGFGGPGEIDIAKATGLQLARGQVSVETLSPVGSPPEETDFSDNVRPRPWAWLGLALPICLTVLGAAALAGRLPPRAGGAATVALAAAGLVVVALACRVSYTDAIAAQQAEEAASQPSTDTASKGADLIDEADLNARILEATRTRPTGFLWLTLLGYLLVAGCGVMGLLPRRSRV